MGPDGGTVKMPLSQYNQRGGNSIGQRHPSAQRMDRQGRGVIVRADPR